MENQTTNSSNLLDEQRKHALAKCDELIKDFATRADRNKYRFRRLQFISVAFGICTTLLSALAAGKALGPFDWVVPLSSGLATLATTFLSQTTTQKIWVGSRSASQQFQSEKFLFLQDSGEYKKLGSVSEKINLFSERIMAIWSGAQETWAQQSSSKS